MSDMDMAMNKSFDKSQEREDQRMKGVSLTNPCPVKKLAAIDKICDPYSVSMTVSASTSACQFLDGSKGFSGAHELS